VSKKKNGNTFIQLTDPPAEKKPARIKATEMKVFEPLTANQSKFFESYKRGDYFTMLCGSAGTGKTFIAVYQALTEVLDKTSPFHHVIIVRSAVQSRDLGFTPGSVEEKMSLYEQPYMQICHTLFGRRDAYDALKECGRIEFISTSFIRGMSFDDSIIIVDECQNMTFEELSTIMTRVGYRSKIIFCGDYRQTDLYRNNKDKSGMRKFHEVALTMPSFTNIEFTTDDIVRSSLVKDFLIAVEKYEWEHESGDWGNVPRKG
jgi:phosphate starvation-inducible protein PhoH and related proteins